MIEERVREFVDNRISEVRNKVSILKYLFCYSSLLY